jgi:hypothetical protein
MKKLLAICLSLSGCANLPDQPDGWSCSFFYDKINPLSSVFLCNRIEDVSIQKEFPIQDPLVFGAKCMDLDTFAAYSDYVYKLRKEVIQCRGN